MTRSLWLPLLSFSPLALAQSLSLSISPTRDGASVSDILSPSFAGFGIEPSNLFSFTGNSNANNFTVQLLQNLADYSGNPPHIRLGGNTQDYMLFDETYTDLNWKENNQSSAQGAIAADSMIIGPGYFEALDRFPKDTPVTYGLNLAYQGSDYLERIAAAAKGAIEGMKNVKLYSFEIGNEPDLYLENSFRTAPWDGATYVEQFMERADAVYKNVLKPAGMAATFFEPPATASTIGTTFEISQLTNNGLLDQVDGEYYVGWWNQHDYFQFIGVTTEAITLDNLMDLDTTNKQFDYWEKQIKIGLDTGLPYVLREMSSVGPIGLDGVSNVFGASLWTLNFFLYMATLNVSSVQMHMTDNSNASAWQPFVFNGIDPFVRPQYYAHAALAQVIGNGNGTTQIGVLDTSSGVGEYKGYLRAYSAYANGNIQSVVLINSMPVNASEPKSSFTFTLDLGSENADRQVFLSYLTADGADSKTGTMWNGMTFSDADGKASMADDTIFVSKTDGDGKVAVEVRDTQAIVANLDWLIGTNEVVKGDGTTTSGSRRKSSAGPVTTSGASTAVWGGVVTTTWALASSFTGGGGFLAEETGVQQRAVGARRGGIGWRTMSVGLFVVMAGFFCFA